MASRGRAMPKSRASACAVACPAATMAAADSPAIACARLTCTLTGTTRKDGPASIMTARASPPASAARNSVWPGNGKPAPRRTFLWIGLVTTAAASPACVRRTASSIALMTEGAVAACGRPGTGICGSGRCSTGKPRANAAIAAAGSVMRTSGTPRSSAAASTARCPASAMIKKGGTPSSSRLSHALSVISAPIPAGSPMLRASGSGRMLVVTGGFRSARRASSRAAAGATRQPAAPRAGGAAPRCAPHHRPRPHRVRTP